MALPVVAPQTGPAKRGPRQATAAQGNYLANQAARRPTVAPTTPPNKPNPFSASGVSSSPAASGSPGMSASGASSIPAASSAGASSTPASLGMTPSASGQMKRGGTAKRYAGGGATETNQYGSWGGANTANAINSVNAGAGGYSPGPLLTTPAAPSTGPFSTTPGTSPLGGGGGGGGGGSGGPTLPGTASNYQSALSGYNSNFGSTYVNARQDAVFGGSYTPYNVTNRGAWDTLTGGEQAYLEDKAGDFNGPSTGGIGLTAASGGSIPAFDDGGEVPDPGGVDPSQGQEGQAGDLAGAL